MANSYAQIRFTNVSGSEKTFTWIPGSPGGYTLANNGSVTIPEERLSEMNEIDRRAYEAALDASTLRVEKLPVVDPSGFFSQSVKFSETVPDSDNTSNYTGAISDVFKTNRRPIGKMEVIGAEFQVLGVPFITYASDVSRNIALYIDGNKASEWQNIGPTGISGESIGGVMTGTTFSDIHEAPTYGDILRFGNISPTGAVITAGSSVQAYITAGHTGAGATGTIRIECIPSA